MRGSKSCFADTNLLVYSIDASSSLKRSFSARLLQDLARTGRLVLSVQSLNELYWVGQRKLRVPLPELRATIRDFSPAATAPFDRSTCELAYEVEDETRFSYYDCLLLASALQARCGIFYSEDLQDGRCLDGLRIINPFARSADGAVY